MLVSKEFQASEIEAQAYASAEDEISRAERVYGFDSPEAKQAIEKADSIPSEAQDKYLALVVDEKTWKRSQSAPKQQIIEYLDSFTGRVVDDYADELARYRIAKFIFNRCPELFDWGIKDIINGELTT